MEPPPLPLKFPMKPPLITPSASPPPLRTETRYSRPTSEGAPPRKRQRTLSTPRPSTQGTPGPSSSSQDPVDIHYERRASTMRLLEFWDSLASHTRALDDDDIVDVMTGRITRDNGVLRSSDVFTFGKDKAPSEAASDDDEGSDAEEGDGGEYEADELDAFGGEEEEESLDVDDGGGLALDMGRLMPPVTPLDPADANDLREFMEAEKRRREICGSDVEGQDADEEDSEVDEVTTDEVRSDIDWRETHAPPSDEDEHEDVELVAERDLEPEVHDEYYTDYVVPLNCSDDDELDDWGADPANLVYPVNKAALQTIHSEDEDETLEAPPPQPPKKNDKQKAPSISPTKPRLQLQPKHTPKPPRQLYTPPQSHASSRPSATPVVDPNFIDLSEDTPPASPVLRPTVTRSPAKAKAATSPVKKAKEPVVHQHSSSESESDAPETSTRRVKGHKHSAHDDPASAITRTPKRAAAAVQHQPASTSTSRGRTPKHSAYVLLTPRNTSSPQKASPAGGDEDEGGVDLPSPTKPSTKGKEKMREVADDSEPMSRKGDLNGRDQGRRNSSGKPRSASRRRSPKGASHPSPSKTLRTQTPRTEDDVWSSPPASESVSRVTPDNMRFLSPTFPSPPPPVVRKRKRVRSDTEMELVELESDNAAARPQGEPSRRPTHASSQHASTSRVHSDDSRPAKRDTSKKRSSSKQRRRRTPESESDSDSSAAASDYRSYPSAPVPVLYSYPHQPAYAPMHHHPPPPGYAPIPDPRAQLIITQAMQQLSALVGAPWGHPHLPPHQYHEGQYHESAAHQYHESASAAVAPPHTPSHRRHSTRPPGSAPFTTPTHRPHPYAQAYDPAFSRATLPPDSPDVSSSSPEKAPGSGGAPRRKSLVGRSRSRGRRVSFRIADLDADEEEAGAGAGYSSPSERQSAGRRREEQRSTADGKGKGKEKTRAQTPYVPAAESEEDDRAVESDDILTDDPTSWRGRGRAMYSRGQTPGPGASSPVGRRASSANGSASGRSGRRHSRHDYGEG